MSLPEPLPILAKPSWRGITLAAHTKHVRDEAARVAAARPFVCRKYRQRTGGDLAEQMDLSALWHDQGKRHKRWQVPCQDDYRESVRTESDCGRRIMRAGIRHELASLKLMREAKAELPLIVRAAVAAHHSKLSHRHKDRWKDAGEPTFELFWKEFLTTSTQFRIGAKSDYERAVSERYKFVGARALLQLADRRASAAEEEEILPPLETFRYEFPHKDADGHPSYRGVQKEVRKFWDEPFAVLRAPTGAGKTDAALLWAQRQVEQGRADRLVIAMPTRFTANALAITASKNLSATGLYHSSALYTRTKDLYEPRQANEDAETNDRLYECSYENLTIKEVERFIDKEQELARKLETPVTVTTIDHLCIALTGTREDHHAIFFNLAHSCLVIDEADFYDEFTQQNIVMLLRALRELDVPVLLMSATVPESALEVYSESGLKATQIYEDKTNYEDTRLTLTLFRRPAYEADDFAELLERALDGEPTIIYVNTVRRAQELYRWFLRKIKDGGAAIERDELLLYHSRYTEPHKVNKEAKLLSLLGREAWAKGRARGVAILTQIGEVSVNISANLMISELCPVDRLAQRAGRLARFERPDGSRCNGELFVIEPHRINKKTGLPELSPAPYGYYTNGTGWELSQALERSREFLSEGTYSAKKFVDLTNMVYPATEEIASHALQNREQLRKCAILNWLILPQEQVGSEGDDERTLHWRSRDIPFQNTVYANFRMSGFDYEKVDELPTTYRDRRRFELRHGVKCHTYEFAHAVKNELLVKHTIYLRERDPETVYIVPDKYYSEDMGLLFTCDESEDFDDGPERSRAGVDRQ